VAALAATLCLGLAACSSDEDLNLAPVPGFDGLVATGEPNATVVGRKILAEGGTAADAAVAVTLAMAVTYPSRVSLGGGGVCLVHDRERQVTEALSFLPTSAASGGVPPGMTRGLEALHARYGGVAWPALVSAGESLARFGFRASRALSADVLAAQNLLARDKALAGLFLPNGQPIRENATITQPALAESLAGIRRESASYFLIGPAGEKYAKASSAAGLTLTEAEIRNRVPEYQVPLTLDRGTDYIFLTPPPAVNGLVAGEIYQILADLTNYDDADPAQRQHLFLEASAQAFADRGGWLSGQSQIAAETLLDEDALSARLAGIGETAHRGGLVPTPRELVEPLAGTGFVIGDRYGNAVACSLTMNGLFGSARMAGDSGIVMAAPPPENLVVSPVAAMVASVGTQRARLAAAGSGGAAGATALARVLIDVLEREETLGQAMREVRTHHNGLPDVAFIEDRADGSVREILINLNHTLQPVPALGEVQAWYCANGILQQPELCEVHADPRGFGLAQIAP